MQLQNVNLFKNFLRAISILFHLFSKNVSVKIDVESAES